MEIGKKELKDILTEQRKEFEETVDKKFQERTEIVLIEQRKEFERYTGALKEDFSSQLQGVADSVFGTNQKLDSVMEMVAKNTEDIDVMKGSMNLMQSDIKDLKEDMSVVKSDISTIKFDLKNKVDLDEFKSLEKRVLFLERKTSHA